MKKRSLLSAVVLAWALSAGCGSPPPQQAVETVQDLSDWLSYSIEPDQLQIAKRPTVWGNGQIFLVCELDRPIVSEAAVFGFGDKGLRYGNSTGRGEQHLIPAIYDNDTGKKYLLHAVHSGAQRATVTFRPDRQIWHYEFDDLTVDVSLILPRLHPGYFYKLELIPHSGNQTKRWRIYHQLRGYQGNILFGTKAGYSLSNGTAWCSTRSPADRSRSPNQLAVA